VEKSGNKQEPTCSYLARPAYLPGKEADVEEHDMEISFSAGKKYFWEDLIRDIGAKADWRSLPLLPVISPSRKATIP
jgi:hypothetical protein